VGCIEVPRREASAFGVMATDGQGRITRFDEKPADPAGIPERPDMALASMGIYIFNADALYDLLDEDLADPTSTHDFGADVIPRLVARGQAQAHSFSRSCVTSNSDAEDYWRDVGTLDAFWAANLDLAETVPQLDIYDTEWPIWTHQFQTPPAKFIPDRNGHCGANCNSMVASGCVVAGSKVAHSVLFANVRIESYCQIEQAVILPGSTVGEGSRLRKVIIDCNCQIPAGSVIGEDPVADALRFERSAGGVVLVTSDMLSLLRG
jgi:glucose-1-phosphate adenylyltransferase